MIGVVMYITIKSLCERHKNKSLISRLTGHDWKTVAQKIANTRKAYWHIAGGSLNSALPNAYWANLGLMRLTNRYCDIN